MEFDDLVLCLGVTKTEVHLLQLDDPSCVKTGPCIWNKNFMTGNWYRKQVEAAAGGRRKQEKERYKLVVENVIPTAVRRIDEVGGRVCIELELPVFVAPNLSGIQQFGHCMNTVAGPTLVSLQCPLFGTNRNDQYLPSVKCSSSNASCLYSNKLYSLKVTLDFTVGKLPKFLLPHLNIEQLVFKPWDIEQYPIIRQLCAARTTGLVVEEVKQLYDDQKNIQMQFCLLLSNQSELAIAVCPSGKFVTVGQFIEYWPINLDCFTIALYCVALNTLVDDELRLHDGLEANDERDGQRIIIQIRPTWCLPKKSVAWTVCAKKYANSIGDAQQPMKECASNANGLVADNTADCISNSNNEGWTKSASIMDGRRSMESTSPAIVAARINNNDANAIDRINGTNKKSPMQQQQKPEIVSNDNNNNNDNNTRANKGIIASLSSSSSVANIGNKRAIAALVTIRRDLPITDIKRVGVLLLWDEKKANFTAKYYAKYKKNFEPNGFGSWYELNYMEMPDKTYIDVLDYKHLAQQCETRSRDGICAQFKLKGGEKFMKVWHMGFPCKSRNNYYLDGDWFPWLCKDCFSGLPNKVDTSTARDNQLEDGRGSGIMNNKEAQKSTGEFAVDKKEQQQQDKNSTMDALFTRQMPTTTKQLTTRPASVTPLASNKVSTTTTTMGTSKLNLQQKQQTLESPNLSSFLSPSTTATAAANKQSSVRQTFGPERIASLPALNVDGTALAVFFGIRNDNGDSVLLIWNEEQRNFAYRLYADPPDKLATYAYNASIFSDSTKKLDACPPSIGEWYRIQFKLNSHDKGLETGKKIFIRSIMWPQKEPRMETRVVDGICAQFKSKVKLFDVWHKRMDCKSWVNKSQLLAGGLWWPIICDTCFPGAKNTSAAATGADNQNVEGLKNPKKQQQWTGKSLEQEWSDSTEADEMDSNIGSSCMDSSSTMDKLVEDSEMTATPSHAHFGATLPYSMPPPPPLPTAIPHFSSSQQNVLNNNISNQQPQLQLEAAATPVVEANNSVNDNNNSNSGNDNDNPSSLLHQLDMVELDLSPLMSTTPASSAAASLRDSAGAISGASSEAEYGLDVAAAVNAHDDDSETSGSTTHKFRGRYLASVANFFTRADKASPPTTTTTTSITHGATRNSSASGAAAATTTSDRTTPLIFPYKTSTAASSASAPTVPVVPVVDCEDEVPSGSFGSARRRRARLDAQQQNGATFSSVNARKGGFKN